MQYEYKGTVSCNFCSAEADDADDWMNHCRDNGCWYLYCDDCDECFDTPEEAFEHYQDNQCCSYTEEGEWYGFCCKYLSTEKGFLDHCNMKHGGLHHCCTDAVMSCKCGRFRGDYDGYLSHIEELGEMWYCDDCSEFLEDEDLGDHRYHDLSHCVDRTDDLQDETGDDQQIDELKDDVAAVTERVEEIALQVQQGSIILSQQIDSIKSQTAAVRLEINGVRGLKQLREEQDRMKSTIHELKGQFTALKDTVTELSRTITQLKSAQHCDPTTAPQSDES